MTRYIIKERFVKYGINRYVFEAYELSFFGLIKTAVNSTYSYTLKECRKKLGLEIQRIKNMKKHDLVVSEIIEIE